MSNREKFNTLKKLDLKPFHVNLCVIKRDLINRKAKYKVFNVNIGAELSKKLKNIVKNALLNLGHLKSYSYITEDQDENVLEIDYEETDFKELLKVLNNASDNPTIMNENELKDIFAYVIDIKNNLLEEQLRLLAIIKVTGVMSMKPGLINMIFKNAKFEDLEEQPVLRISSKIDFIFFKETLFILNKKNFETTLNFREGMIQNRDKLLDELKNLGIIEGIDILKNAIGDNISYLRKANIIKKNAYYKTADFIKKLIETSNIRKWGLQIENGKIVVTEDNIDLILRLLNNDRLESPINEELFDVSVKKLVE